MLKYIIVGLLALLGGAAAKEDLPADASLRIGVKHRPEVCERKSKNGDKISVHYTGVLSALRIMTLDRDPCSPLVSTRRFRHWCAAGSLYKDGSKFDSSRDRDAPFDLTLGRGQVIRGWEEGLQNMCVGERRKLIIPSGKGYGANGSPPKIHGGATLVFDVEMLGIN
jgi:hypothetical protein